MGAFAYIVGLAIYVFGIGYYKPFEKIDEEFKIPAMVVSTLFWPFSICIFGLVYLFKLGDKTKKKPFGPTSTKRGGF